MSSDLVSVLSEGTLRDHTEECTLLLSGAFPEEQREEWMDTLNKEAAAADECEDTDEAAAKASALVSKLVKATPGLVPGTERGMYI